MTDARIVGITLVRNEDIFIDRVVRNVAGFCDTLIVADHESTDRTWSILSGLARELPNLELNRIDDPSESHALIERFAGSNSWIFAVDGDEVFDPRGLKRIRGRILAGEFQKWWQVFGNVLNCTEIDYGRLTAKGYLAPPCRSITKLFNFSAIESWTGRCPERLHGGRIAFRPGFDGKTRLNLQHQNSWEEADLRCLHTCFMKRSSSDRPGHGIRMNIAERNQNASSSAYSRLVRYFSAGGGRGWYKRDKYMRGPLVECDISGFLDPPACADPAPGS